MNILGVIVGNGKIRMDPVKVAGVRNWQAPQSVKDVQSFLGFLNFYRRFIPNFGHHARPLTRLTQKDCKWTWGPVEHAAFRKLIDLVTSEPVLHFPMDDGEWRVEADSSDFATGACLSQCQNGRWVPIAFLSKSLSETEHNYDIHDKEMLAIMRALEEWCHYLQGSTKCFEIWTDHKNLEYFTTSKKLNRRQARWSLELAEYDFALLHKPGKTHGKTDALSCRKGHKRGENDNEGITLLKEEFFRAMPAVLDDTPGDQFMEDIKAKKDQWEHKVKEMLTQENTDWEDHGEFLSYRQTVYVPNDLALRYKIT